MRSGIQKTKSNQSKGKLRAADGLPDKFGNGNMAPMKRFAIAALLSLAFVAPIRAQTSPSATPGPADAVQIEAVMKKLDEQSAKIDALSQQILKLQQEVANKRPGVVIGEPEATSTTAQTPAGVGGANTHTVARGETLTSIAKQYKVSVEDLQRVNQIEDGRKLQAGQTITIPSPPVQPSPSSPAPTP